MEPNNNLLRDRLLSGSPKPDDFANYREQISSLIDSNQKRLRRERIVTTVFWIFCAISATAWLWFSADSARLPRGPFLACLFFIWGGVEILKHYINATRLEILKELKQVQLQVFAIRADVTVRPSAP